MAKRKLTSIVTPNTLESMTKYMLISSILYRIREMTKKSLEYPRDDTRLIPFQDLLEIKTWGTKWKRVIDTKIKMGGMVMGKCQDRQRKSCIIQTNCKHFQGGYGRL